MGAAVVIWRGALFAGALSLVAATAQAGEASDVASRGGFLLGHAYRCGVKVEALQPSADLIHRLSNALATDDSEKTDADKVFAERFVVSAAADGLGDLLPSCPAIKKALAMFEKHDPDVASGSSSPPAQAGATVQPTAQRALNHAHGAKAHLPPHKRIVNRRRSGQPA